MPRKPKNDARSTTDAPSPLPADALRWRCDESCLDFESTADVTPVTGVVGQDSAVEALRFGLETDAPGQNIFVRGLTGTGRLTLVRRQLEELRPVCKLTKDCCYVHSFANPECPRLITLPAGNAKTFRRRIDKLADFIRDDLATALSSEGITARRKVVEDRTRTRLAAVVQPFEEEIKQAGLTLVTVEAGPVFQSALFPLVDGKAVAPEEFDQLHTQGEIEDATYKSVRDSFQTFERKLEEVTRQADEIRREHDESVSAITETATRSSLAGIIDGITRLFDQDAVTTFLAEIVDDVVMQRLGMLGGDVDFTRLYRVNVVSEHHGADSCPIIVENTATVRNLLGTVEMDFDHTDSIRPTHMGIRAGSILRADGGFLIIEDRDILDETDAWKCLKRVLRSRRLDPAPPGGMNQGGAPAVKPESIEINVKVVMLGDPETYAMLDGGDPDFPHLFKVLADFDEVIPRDAEGVKHYACVLARIATEENLRHFHHSAVAALTEHGARIAATSGKLTARFGRLADIAREAAFVANKCDHELVLADDVHAAIRRGRNRADLPSRRFRELVSNGSIRVETSGSVEGQVNGMAVMQAGPLIYGFPTRITATVGPGTAGVINIEREAALSGAIHTKGFYILRGLLRQILRTDHPLAFDASIAFEQTYGGIDGDSASGAEICCLLSALTRIPIRQDIAMTGAIDQMGHMLAVGAVDQKIEGFYDACHDLGGHSTQGVVIPKSNAPDLMLREDVVEACVRGEFRVYAVETVHEAITLLTGRPAGARDADGNYASDSVLGVAVRRAREYWEIVRHATVVQPQRKTR